MTLQNLPSFELEALHTLLEQEFEFLKKQDFKSFEELQHKKQDLLNLLVDEISGKDPEITPEAIQNLIKENKELSNRLIECQNLQKRKTFQQLYIDYQYCSQGVISPDQFAHFHK